MGIGGVGGLSFCYYDLSFGLQATNRNSEIFSDFKVETMFFQPASGSIRANPI